MRNTQADGQRAMLNSMIHPPVCEPSSIYTKVQAYTQRNTLGWFWIYFHVFYGWVFHVCNKQKSMWSRLICIYIVQLRCLRTIPFSLHYYVLYTHDMVRIWLGYYLLNTMHECTHRTTGLNYMFRKRQTVIKCEASWRFLNAFFSSNILFCVMAACVYSLSDADFDCTPKCITANRKNRCGDYV